MKTVSTKVTYTVPSWNFCNVDHWGIDKVSKQTCRFCVKDRNGVRCMLHNESLSTSDGLIQKARKCCEVTAGFLVTIGPDRNEAPLPTIQPKDLIKQTLDLYIKTVNKLVDQGYPRSMAETAARQYILED